MNHHAATSAGPRTRLSVTAMLDNALSALLKPLSLFATNEPATTPPLTDGQAQTPDELLQLHRALSRDWDLARLRRDMRRCKTLEGQNGAVVRTILGRVR